MAGFESQWESIIEDCYWVDWEIDFDNNTLETTEETSNIPQNKNSEIILNKEDEEFYYMNKYKLGYDVEEIALELIEDARFTNQKKANIFDDYFTILWFKVSLSFL